MGRKYRRQNPQQENAIAAFRKLNRVWERVVAREIENSWKGVHPPEMRDAIEMELLSAREELKIGQRFFTEFLKKNIKAEMARQEAAQEEGVIVPMGTCDSTTVSKEAMDAVIDRFYEQAEQQGPYPWEPLTPTECCPCGSYQCSVPMPLHGRVRDVDVCISHIVAALNAGGVTTVASCCGHGERPGSIALENGIVLTVHGLNKTKEGDI